MALPMLLSVAIPSVLLTATCGALWLAAYFWTHRQRPGAVWFGCCLLACALWTALDASSFLVTSAIAQDVLRRLVWLVVVAVTVSFFRFATAYAQRSSWWRAVRVPVAVAVLAEIVIMATNRQHHLMWRQSEWIAVGSTRIPALTPGPAFYWLHVPLAYGLILGGVVVLFAHTLGSQRFYLQRVTVLSIGMTAPLLVNVFVVSHMTRGVDLTPIGLLVAFAAVAWVALHERLLDVMPAVRGLLFQQHRDGVVVLDLESRLLDLNPAASRLLGAVAIPQGLPVSALLPFWDRVRTVVEVGDGGGVEIAFDGLVLDVRARVIRDDKQRVIGRLVVLHDVTERARLIRELDAYARTVAHDLKNPLSAATGYLELVGITEPNMPEDTARLLEHAQQVCQQMTAIIDTLLRRRGRISGARTALMRAPQISGDCPRPLMRFVI